MTRLDPETCAGIVKSERWAQRVSADDSGCIRWSGATSREGYGNIRVAGRPALVHRVAWIAATGREIPEGLHLDHLCRVRNCVNPDHLEPVTCRENILRGESPAADRARRTHCPRGHELAGDNLRPDRLLKKGQRTCIRCHRDADAARYPLILKAAAALGLSGPQYRAQFGQSLQVARQIIDDSIEVAL